MVNKSFELAGVKQLKHLMRGDRFKTEQEMVKEIRQVNREVGAKGITAMYRRIKGSISTGWKAAMLEKGEDRGEKNG